MKEESTPYKTGAVICKRPDKENELAYEARLFITDIPDEITDLQLKEIVSRNKIRVDLADCSALIFRADVHATSNEVQEQFEHLHEREKSVRQISFGELIENNSINGV